MEPKKLRQDWNRNRIMKAIIAEGVPCQSGICGEIYREGAFERLGWTPPERFQTAHELGETSLMFQVHPTLTDSCIEDTIAAVRKVFRSAAK